VVAIRATGVGFATQATIGLAMQPVVATRAELGCDKGTGWRITLVVAASQMAAPKPVEPLTVSVSHPTTTSTVAVKTQRQRSKGEGPHPTTTINGGTSKFDGGGAQTV